MLVRLLFPITIDELLCCRVMCFATFVSLLCFQPVVAQTTRPPAGYVAKSKVTSVTEIDWVYVLANQSPSEPPPELLKEYLSTAQTFELYVPPSYNAKKKYPLVIFVSPSDQAMGFNNWQEICEKEQIIFAGPHAAGNECAMPQRVRIVLDVLHQVRSDFNIDTDRTYISGFSGGGRVSCAIGFALPEYFGGVIPICAGGDLRQEDWLRQRVIDRLSVAGLTGETDFNRGEVERYRQALLSGVGVRSKVWVAANTGHAIPSDELLGEAFKFVEAGLDARRKLAEQFPASRADDRLVANRETQASAMLQEATSRSAHKQTLHSGLMIMKGIATRWPDLPIAKQAEQTLLRYEQEEDPSWREADVALQRRFLIARARAVDSYGSGELHKNYQAQRADMLRAAIQLWNLVIEDGQDQTAIEQARKRIPALEKMLAE